MANKYLDFYKKCMEDGEMLPPNGDSINYRCGGLCKALELRCGDSFFDGPVDLFAPKHGEGWWGGEKYRFTEFRQNVVLFLAAMNNEDFTSLKIK